MKDDETKRKEADDEVARIRGDHTERTKQPAVRMSAAARLALGKADSHANFYVTLTNIIVKSAKESVADEIPDALQAMFNTMACVIMYCYGRAQDDCGENAKFEVVKAKFMERLDKELARFDKEYEIPDYKGCQCPACKQAAGESEDGPGKTQAQAAGQRLH